MKLYFLRHAEAEDGLVDAERELTGKGRRDARKLGRFFRRHDVEFELAFTSPLVRARQTAELVLTECPLGGKQPLAETPALLNGTTAREFARWLKALPPVDAVLLVGHEPSMSERIRGLLGLPRVDALPLGKCAVARLDTEDRRTGALRFLLGPKQLS